MKDTARALALGAGIFLVMVLLMHLGNPYPSTPEMSCFGGSSNALILRGGASRFEWQNGSRYVVALLGSIGGAGSSWLAIDVLPKLTRASAAVFITAAIYWAAMIPLWFFNDRYFRVLVPAGALILALTPLRENVPMKVAAFAMTAVMGFDVAGRRVRLSARNRGNGCGARSVGKAGHRASRHRRGIRTERTGPVSIYRVGSGEQTEQADIPMITSATLEEYTLAMRPLPGTEVVGTISWPGPFGLGTRQNVRGAPGRPDQKTRLKSVLRHTELRRDGGWRSYPESSGAGPGSM